MRLIFLLLAVTFAGCYTPQKAARQMDRAHTTYPIVSASRCETYYPIKWFDSTLLEYVPGEVQYRYDSVEFNLDSLLSELSRFSSTADSFEPPVPDPAKPTVIKIPCPPCLERVDTVKSVTNKQGENTAAIERWRLAYEDLDAKCRKLEIGNSRKSLALWILGVICGLFSLRLVYKIWKAKK